MTPAVRRLRRQITRVFTLVLPLTCGVGTALATLITFEANHGQTAAEVAFLSRTARYRLFLTRRGAVIALQDGHAVRIRLAHSRNTAPVGTHLLVTKTNYLLGPDPARWKKDIPNYQAVRYSQVYPGIDLTWHAHGDELEHDFLVAPAADPGRIHLRFSGATLRLIPEGDLMAGALRFHKPHAFQGSREVECRYQMDGPDVRFVLGPYDRSQPLTIDPVLSFSTFLSGTNDTGTTVSASTTAAATTLDGAGNLYVAGWTSSLDFPVTAGAFQRTSVGGICASGTPKGGNVTVPCNDIFVSKFSGDGSTLLASTYLGGNGEAHAIAIAAGPAGNVYLAGNTSYAPGFPQLTPLPGQSLPSSGTTYFAAKLSADLSSLVYATALPAAPKALAVDGAGAVYLTGATTGGLPTVSAFQQKIADGDVFKTTDGGNHWQALQSNFPADSAVTAAADPINPQVLYRLDANALYKTSDGGVTWTALANGLSSMLYALAVDPHSPQTLYLGGAYLNTACNCLFKSTDGGTTWAASNSGLIADVYSLAVAPTNSSIIYAGTDNGVYKSTDGAATWNRTGLTNPLSTVVVDPTNAATVYAVLSPTGAVMKSTDGGATWNQIGLFQFFAIDPVNPQTLYAARGAVYKSTDGGAHWTQLPSPSPNGYVTGVYVDPRLDSRIWVNVGLALFVSLDSGATWTRTQLPHVPLAPLLTDAAGATVAIRSAGGTLHDGFAMKLDATGSNVVYSTYLGGMGRDVPGGIAVDAAGRAYIAGETDSPDFPLAAPLQPQFGGNSDAFVTVLDPTGSHLVWSTYLGGSAAEGASSLALDAAGNVHLGGVVSPVNPFLTTTLPPGDTTADAFAAKIKGDGSTLIFSTRWGGSNFDGATSVAADAAGNTYIAGSTSSQDLPTLNAVQTTYTGTNGAPDALVAEFNGQTGAFEYATYLGGSQYEYGNALAVDAAGNAYVVGQTSSPDFPLKSAWQSSLPTTSAFIAKLTPQGPNLGMIGLTSAASYSTTVAQGELVSLFGTGLAAGTGSATQLPLPDQLSDVQVTMNGVPVPLVYASPRQINAQLPFEVSPGSAQVQVTSTAGTSTITVNVAGVAPAIFTLNQQGTGPGAILHGRNYQVVNDSNPAAAGEIVSIFCTGLGALSPPAQTGALPPDPPPQTAIPVQVSIASLPATVLYAGVAPGFPGLYQVNAQLPSGTPSGAQPLQIVQNGVASNTVTIAVH